MLSGSVGDSGIAHGHFDFLMTEQLLQYFQSHAGIEQVGGKGVSEAMQAVAVIRQAGTGDCCSHNSPGRHIADVCSPGAVMKEIRRVMVSLIKPVVQGLFCIGTVIDSPPLIVLLAQVDKDSSLSKADVTHLDLKQFTDSHSGPEQE